VPLNHNSASSRHLLHAQERERKRISRELHDETGQALMLLRLHLGILAAKVENRDCQLQILEATELLDRTITGLRRIIGRLSPRVLEELGLLAAIRKEVLELGKGTGIKARLKLPDQLGELDREIQIAAYRCVQEALHNVAKHSQARNLNIEVERRGNRLNLLVQDNGVGMANQGQTPSRGFGLGGMRERVAALGGTLRITSSSPRGTSIRIGFPLANGKVPPKHHPSSEPAVLLNRAAASHLG
jgi:signal transduction histidine kinase